MNQLEKIMEITGKPNKFDIKSIKSKHTQTMIDSIHLKKSVSLSSLYPTASPEALDLLTRLIKNVTENPNEDKYRSFKKVK